MRFFARCLGLFFAAAAFVTIVVDGTRSMADDTLQIQPLGAAWVWVSEAGFMSAQTSVQRDMSSTVWDKLVVPFLSLPLFVVLMILSALFLWLGRRPKSGIGYITRG